MTNYLFCGINNYGKLVRALFKLLNYIGGTMKTLTYITTICLVFFILGASSVQSQTQELEGYTFMRGGMGPQVCLGRWVPSQDIALPGVCEGQVVGLDQLTAISTRLSADTLDQLLLVLTSVDQKLSVNNNQVKRLIEATVNTQALINQQARQISDFLHETITKRFDELPEEILSNDLFKEEITKLREDILKEVEKYYSKKSTPSTK